MGVNKKWIPYSKGGSYRKYYGNLDYVVDWSTDALYFYSTNKTSNLLNEKYWYEEGITYTLVTTKGTSFRYLPKGFVFDMGGPTITFVENLYFIIGLFNSKVANLYLNILNPTINMQVKDIKRMPIYMDESIKPYTEELAKNSLGISKLDWDSFETSWDFKIHPLIKLRQNNALWGEPSAHDFNNNGSIDLSFKAWEHFTNQQFNQLKTNEEELNRIFIDIYGLQDEMTPEVEDKDITISKADRERDIKSFISYAVGCMFGRYSLDEEGLVYAGGKFDIDRYKTFIPTKDNVLVIADDDYFEDDMVNSFVEFVKVTFGEATLEENLNYIAETLGQKANETSRYTIRRYFLKDFYKDHLKTYQKRPIYWLFDSGKADGFKALVYMHRYDMSTVARVRTDYLHKLQRMYEAEVRRLDIIIDSELSTREKAAAKKKKDNINKQIEECLIYDQVIAHIAHQRIEIDLDDGVKHNYGLFQGVEVPQGEGRKPLKANLLAKI